MNLSEERCECGMSISRGYGYYAYGNQLKCFGCGRINKRDHIETPEEFKILLDGKPKQGMSSMGINISQVVDEALVKATNKNITDICKERK